MCNFSPSIPKPPPPPPPPPPSPAPTALAIRPPQARKRRGRLTQGLQALTIQSPTPPVGL